MGSSTVMLRFAQHLSWAQGKNMIKIEHVSRRYRTVEALRDLSLEIPQGSIYGLIGPNGAGKTTLLRILAALLPPNAGMIWFDDLEVTKDPAAIQRKVGY